MRDRHDDDRHHEGTPFGPPPLPDADNGDDRPREEWPMNPDGTLHMTTAPLDLEALLGEAG